MPKMGFVPKKRKGGRTEENTKKRGENQVQERAGEKWGEGEGKPKRSKQGTWLN